MSMKIDRREFIRNLLYAGSAAAIPGYIPSVQAQSNYNGKLLVTLQLLGGLDVTSFCDPKENVTGELEINHWARTGSTQQAGNLRYAPYAGNQQFFEKYNDRTLIINGVDAQTNSHDAGEIINWSGRIAVGFPSITALMAATNAPDLALSYLNFGGFGNTERLLRSTRIDSPEEIRNIIFPNNTNYNPDRKYLAEADWAQIRAMHSANSVRMLAAENLPAGDRSNRLLYQDAFARAESIQVFGNAIPAAELLQQERQIDNLNQDSSRLHQQIQLALLAFSTGVSMTADLTEAGGYDTHDQHDANHEALLSNSLDAIDYLWEYAEELGLADRILLVVGSDFGRTPHYNSAEGKDHWPIGSYMIMEKNVSWTNRMVGETDEGHNAFNINPTSLQRDDSNGTIIYPKHVHKALRRYLGIEDNPITQDFSFIGAEDFSFFS